MKIVATLAGMLLLSVAPAIAQAPSPAPEAAPATAPAAAAASVDQSKLSPNMQSFMGKVDSMRSRRTGRESESTGRVLPPGAPIASKEWHKEQGHKHVNWSGASGYGGGSSHHRHHKKAEAGEAKADKKEDKAEDKKEEKKEDKKAEKAEKKEKKASKKAAGKKAK